MKKACNSRVLGLSMQQQLMDDLNDTRESLKEAEQAVLNQKKARNSVHRSRNEYEEKLRLVQRQVHQLQLWIQDALGLRQMPRKIDGALSDGSVLSLIRIIQRFDTDNDGMLTVENFNNLMVRGTAQNDYDSIVSYQCLERMLDGHRVNRAQRSCTRKRHSKHCVKRWKTTAAAAAATTTTTDLQP